MQNNLNKNQKVLLLLKKGFKVLLEKFDIGKRSDIDWILRELYFWNLRTISIKRKDYDFDKRLLKERTQILDEFNRIWARAYVERQNDRSLITKPDIVDQSVYKKD